MATPSKSKMAGRLSMVNLLGSMSFIVGLIIAIIAGIWWADNEKLILTLVVLGLVVGLINITGREVIPYLVAAIALVLIGQAEPGIFAPLDEIKDGLGGNLDNILRMLAVFAAPAAVVNALRAAVALARPGQAE